MIYGRFGDVVTIVRPAVLDDVQRLDNRKPDAQDRNALENGAYVVVKYADNDKEALYHIGFLKADNGIAEIQESIDAVKAPQFDPSGNPDLDNRKLPRNQRAGKRIKR